MEVGVLTRRILALTVMLVFVLSALPAVAEKKGKCDTCPVASAKTTAAVCPVMGTKIPDVKKAAGKSVYKGKTYYFCCPNSCKAAFDKNPEKYIKAPKK